MKKILCYIIFLSIPTLAFSNHLSNKQIFISLPNIIIKQKNFYIESKINHYEIKSSYPQLQGNQTEQVINFFNKKIAAKIKEIQSKFIKNSIKNNTKAHENLPTRPTLKSILTINYQITDASHGVLSLIISVDENYAGAAHPTSYNFSYNFDVLRNKFLKLSDLFVGSNDLKIIAKNCQAALMKKFIAGNLPEDNKSYEKIWIITGTEPNQKNYQRWNLTQNGLMITFDPAQVVSAVYGRQQVVIPYSILSPNYVRLQTLPAKTKRNSK